MSSVVALQPVAAVFREEQYFDWRIYSLIAIVGLITGIGLLRGRAWSFEVVLGLLIGLALLMFLIVLSIAYDDRSECDRSFCVVRVGSIASARCTDQRGPERRSRHLPPHRRLRMLGNSIRTRR